MRARRALAVLYNAAIWAVCLLPLGGSGSAGPASVFALPDEAWHVLMFALLVLAWRLEGRDLTSAMFISVLTAVGTEAAQVPLPYRAGSWVDLLADLVGIGAMALAIRLAEAVGGGVRDGEATAPRAR